MVKRFLFLFALLGALVLHDGASAAVPAGDAMLKKLTLSSATVTGGASVTLTVGLTAAAPKGGVTVWMKVERPDLVSMPESVTVPAGSSNAKVSVATAAVSTSQSFGIYATDGRAETKIALTIASPRVAKVALSPASVIGGQQVKATVTLSGVAPSEGLWVETWAEGDGAKVDGKVFVPGGSRSATFLVSTWDVGYVANAVVGAAYDAKATANLTISPIALKSVTVTPAAVTSGGRVRLTVNLNGPAPADLTVYVKTSDWGLAPVGEAITIKAGAKSATVTFKAGAVKEATKVEVAVYLNDTSASTVFTVQPPVK